MTTAEIAAEHGVSRQTIHTYRRTGIFPAPVEGEGSTRPRFREDEVAAFFEANPKQPRKKRRPPSDQQGDPVMSAPARGGLTDKDYEDRESILGAADVIQRRWPDEYPTLVRDLRDLVETISEEADSSDG
jgi:predicted DNA-binding transcriptional regulator AlpA